MSSATSKVLNALGNGQELTAKQIAARYKVNPYAVIQTLRKSGHAIYLNERKNYKGETVNKYRLGTPSRSMIANWSVKGTA